ncbi:MAG: recombinase family protein [Nakamurella sp.]
MSLKIGYARCSTDAQDLTAQRQQLLALGVDENRLYTDHGVTGANRDRPGLRQALAAVRPKDTLVVTKLDRLARSVPDARAIADELVAGEVALSIGGTVHDPTDPTGRLLFNALAMIAEFERDLISQRTREGLAIARQKGRLKGKPPKLKPATERHLVQLFHAGDHTVGEMAEMFGISRATVYRAVQRAQAKQAKSDVGV